MTNRRALIGLLLGVFLLYGADLGRIDLWAPDEPRYGAIAEELRSFRHGASGLVLLHLNEAAYTQKPPLYFWLAAAGGAASGRVDEVAARLPSALAGIVCVGLTVWIGWMLLARPVPAILAAGLLATSFRFAFTARRAQLDVLLTAFELGAIAVFVFLETRRGGAGNARQFPASIAFLHASLGAAALVKGPVGWLPLLVFAGYLAWEGRLSAWRAITPAWAWLLTLGPVALWIATAMALAPPGFAEVAVQENLFGRFFAGTSHARPFYYYAIQLPLDFMPWTLLLPFAAPAVWRAARDADPRAGEEPTSRASARFLLAWAMLPLVFFTLSAGKRGVYLLPIFPALALVGVLAVDRFRARGVAIPQSLRRLAIAIAIVAAIELVVFLVVFPALQDEKSPRPIAEAAAAVSTEVNPVGVYGLRPLEGALVYYGVPRVASLEDEHDLRRFFDEGNRFVILRARHFEALAEDHDLIEIRSFRSGRRRLTLAQRRDLIPRREPPREGGDSIRD